MSIFRRASPAPRASQASNSGPSAGEPQPPGVTRVAAGSCLRGELTGSTEVVIEGVVQGAVRVGSTVVIAPGGLVEGPVEAAVVRLAGKVVGDVSGSDRVEVSDSGVLEGDVVAPRVVIAEGAFLKGMVQMQGDKARGERQAKATVVEPGRNG